MSTCRALPGPNEASRARTLQPFRVRQPRRCRTRATTYRSHVNFRWRDALPWGVLLYEMTTGQRPFPATSSRPRSSPRSCRAIRFRCAPSSRRRPALERIILTALEKNPEALADRARCGIVANLRGGGGAGADPAAHAVVRACRRHRRGAAHVRRHQVLLTRGNPWPAGASAARAASRHDAGDFAGIAEFSRCRRTDERSASSPRRGAGGRSICGRSIRWPSARWRDGERVQSLLVAGRRVDRLQRGRQAMEDTRGRRRGAAICDVNSTAAVASWGGNTILFIDRREGASCG